MNHDYRELLAYKVEYALTWYFMRKGAHQPVYFDPKVLEKGFILEQAGILTWKRCPSH